MTAALLDLDDAPSIAEVVESGLGHQVRVSGGSYVVRVSLASGNHAVFVLNRREYEEWRAHQDEHPTPPLIAIDAFGVVDRRLRKHHRRTRRR